MKIAALIIGIDGWEKYTLPLIQSIGRYEPDCLVTVVDNASETPYPYHPIVEGNQHYLLTRTKRLCYSAAINHAKKCSNDADWYIVLSNDVLCTGPFAHKLANVNPDVVMGPCLKRNEAATYLEGWCVVESWLLHQTIGGWDEQFQVSSWEDVDRSVSAVKAGFLLAHDMTFPFVHLDQKQRFGLIPNYWDSERHNVAYFAHKHGLNERAAG